MSRLQPLTILVASADAERMHAALTLAASHAALEAPVRLFLHAGAVQLLRAPVAMAEDARFGAAGLPTLAEMLAEAMALGVEIVACQSGLHLAGMHAGDLPAGARAGGLLELLAREDRGDLVVA